MEVQRGQAQCATSRRWVWSGIILKVLASETLVPQERPNKKISLYHLWIDKLIAFKGRPMRQSRAIYIFPLISNW